MSNQDRTTNFNRYRRTEAAPAQQGGIFATEGGQTTLTDGNGNKTWFADTTSGNVTLTLPAARDTAGTLYRVKRTTAGANTLTVTTVSGNIDNAATKLMPTQYDKFTFTSDGSNYWIIA